MSRTEKPSQWQTNRRFWCLSFCLCLRRPKHEISKISLPWYFCSEVNPILGPVTAHPSASHFISTACLPTTLVPPHSMCDVSMTSTPAQNVSTSSMLPNAPFQADSTVLVGSGANTIQSVSRTNFNRTRGFTQQIYVDSAETAERARLAHEARVSLSMSAINRGSFRSNWM